MKKILITIAALALSGQAYSDKYNPGKRDDYQKPNHGYHEHHKDGHHRDYYQDRHYYSYGYCCSPIVVYPTPGYVYTPGIGVYIGNGTGFGWIGVH